MQKSQREPTRALRHHKLPLYPTTPFFYLGHLPNMSLISNIHLQKKII